MATDFVFRLTVNGIAPIVGIQQNVMHYRLEAAGTHMDFELAEDLLGSWNTHNSANLVNVLGNNCSLESLSAERVSITGGPTALLPVNLAGTAGPDTDDSALSMCIAFIPGAPPYRRKLGRFYMFGIPTGSLVDNVWTPAWLISAATFATPLINHLPSGLEVGNHWIPVIYDRATQTGVDVAFQNLRFRPSHLKRRQRPYPV